MMMWIDQSTHKVLWELDTEHIFAGVLVGDNWVATVLVHVDPVSGSLYPIRDSHVFIPVNHGHTPSLRQIEDALEKSWTALNGPEIEYSHLFLCLPAWCCRGQTATARTTISDAEHTPGLWWSKVASYHVRELQEKLYAEISSSKYVACDLMPLSFVLDNGCRLADPVDSITNTLDLDAYAIMADAGVIEALLERLRRLGLKADVVTTAFVAGREFLSLEDRDRGVVLMDVDQRSVTASVYRDGLMAETAVVPEGSDGILGSTADRLHMGAWPLGVLLKERRDVLSATDANEETVLHSSCSRGGKAVTVRDLEEAAKASADALVRQVQDALGLSSREKRSGLRKIVLIGDEPLVLRAVKRAAEKRLGLPCAWAVPDRVHAIERIETPGLARMVGLMRQAGLHPPATQPFLEAHNRTPMKSINRMLTERCRQLHQQMLARLRDHTRRNGRGGRPSVTGGVLRMAASGLLAFADWMGRLLQFVARSLGLIHPVFRPKGNHT